MATLPPARESWPCPFIMFRPAQIGAELGGWASPFANTKTNACAAALLLARKHLVRAATTGATRLGLLAQRGQLK
jgi:hypothetical protein